ncbi:MAG: glycosyltransferase family 4 protein, partial [Desulfobacteraceae bacterium]|nr:glycosyltransferase family 4 protein [Desulfobacteraceae bacterium]
MKKVAHFIDSLDPGGAETLVVEICRNLEPHGYLPEVFHFGNAWLEEKCYENKIVSVIVPGYRHYKSIRTIPFFTLAFMRFLKHRDIDILHSQLFGPITGGCFATFFSNIPHVGTLHDTYTIEEKKAKIRLLQLTAFLRTRLITVSQQMRDYLITLGRFPKGSLQIILNGVSLEKFSEPADTKLMTDIGIQHDDFVLICVGRLEKIKGHDVLIEAFSRITSKKV